MEQLAHGQVQEAIETLKQQGRVHEITDRQERLEAIAKAYAERPEQTLVVSPDNRSRQEINERIHHELQSSGRVAEQKYQLGVLVPRQDMTGADRQWAAQQAASSADPRFKVRGFSFGITQSGSNPRVDNELVARTCASRSAAFRP